MVPCLFFFSACSGSNGKSAYELAVEQGFTGTLEEWLESLKGTNGLNGTIENNNSSESSYDIYRKAVELGEYNGKYIDFVRDVLGLTETDPMVVANSCLSSVVTINASSSSSTAEGSGVIYSIDENNNAFIITNYHVVAPVIKGTNVEFSLNLYGNNDEKSFNAYFVGGTKTYDLAVLYAGNCEILEECGAEAVTINTNAPIMGSTCFAIGNTNGDGISITNGCISVDSELRNIEVDGLKIPHRIIRHDAYMYGGNSGGGLFNINGELIGITNAGLKTTTANLIKFAIPSNVVYGVVNNIIKNCFGKSAEQLVSFSYGFETDSVESSQTNEEFIHPVETIKITSINSSILNGKNIQVNDTVVSAKLSNGNTTLSQTITRYYHLEEFLLLADNTHTLTLELSRTGETENIIVEIDLSQLETIFIL